MADMTGGTVDLELAAILVNAVLLCVMGLAMAFAKRIDAFVARCPARRGMTGFFAAGSAVDAVHCPAEPV